MEQQTFADLIKKHFRFLFEEFKFSIVYSEPHPNYANHHVILQAGDCKINMYIDRGWFFIESGVKGTDIKFSVDWLNPASPYQWYDLSLVIPFLTRGSNQVNFEYTESPRGPGYNEEKHVESEMARISTIIRPYIGEIIAFFQEDTFRKKQKDLNEFIEMRAEEKEIKRNRK
jgi:hypothetical protein